MTRSHRHIHRRQDVLDDISDIINGMRRPENDEDGSTRKNVRRGDSDGSDSIKGRAQTTVVQVVYKTMSATFEGPIAGYSTLDKDPRPPTTHAERQGTPKSSKAETSMPTMIRPPQETESIDTVLAKATGSPTPSPTLAMDGSRQLSTSTSSITSATSITDASSASNDSDSGTSAGAKAGIAFGVIGGVFLVGLIVFMLVKRRRKQAQRQQLNDDDEKLHAAVAGGVRRPIDDDMPSSNPGAPRISLRPVTQFLPNWNLEKRTSKGADMSLTPGLAVSSDSSDRPDTSHSSHAANPFGNHAERAPSPIHEEDEGSVSSPGSPPRNLTTEKPLILEPPANVDSAEVAAGVTDAAVAAARPGLARKASMRNQNSNQVDLTMPMPPAFGVIPPSPAGTEFSISSANPGPASLHSQSAAAIAAAGGPANSTVHRVQLDFKPTLEDEMELKAGDLVRLLHEYDDGWALVIRLDRSHQGVVPRTCLSTRPVKPRPAQGRPPVNPSGYPRGPNPPPSQRPMTPQGMYANGPASPSLPRMGPGVVPRPASPASPPMGRPMSPAGQPMSPKSSPPRSSPMNPAQPPTTGPSSGPVGRKPVPGQAY
ncbi:hypothetical protein PT974_00726 [Cladobotryum mycophilum]|uniref:SH3 domain-containing protein n=1 Tax=Cladobotryum mycophilum TaxID=491253 RepID=A0ABR0T1V8_9HYPO